MGFDLYRTDDDIKELWEDFAGVIYPLCCSYMPDTLSADEALVKVFIDAMKYEKDFEHKHDAKKWLILRTDYICNSMLRQWWKSDISYLILDNSDFPQEQDIDNFDEPDTDENYDCTTNNDTGVTIYNKYSFAHETAEITSDMKNIIRLPGKYKLIIYLFCHEELSTMAISEYINLSHQLVRSRLHDARLLLKCKNSIQESCIIYKAAYDKITLSEEKKNYLLELVINKALDEEYQSNIIPKDEEEIYNRLLQNDYDDKAESIALLKANLPKLIPGAICLIAVIVIVIMYFLKNPM